MKIISLRRFRDSIADQGEAVAVARRNPDGVLVVLGTWTPGDVATPYSTEVIEPGYVVPGVERFGHSSPVPKPGKKR